MPNSKLDPNLGESLFICEYNKREQCREIVELIVAKIGRKYTYFADRSELRFDRESGDIQSQDGSKYRIYIPSFRIFASRGEIVVDNERAELSTKLLDYCRVRYSSKFEMVSIDTLRQFVKELTKT